LHIWEVASWKIPPKKSLSLQKAKGKQDAFVYRLLKETSFTLAVNETVISSKLLFKKNNIRYNLYLINIVEHIVFFYHENFLILTISSLFLKQNSFTLSKL